MKASKSFLLNGAATSYWEYGTPDLPTIIMIHGFRGTHHGLQRIVEQLTGFHIVVPDLPGFGDSAPFIQGEHSVEHYTKWLQTFIVQLQLAHPPVLLGHSFGSVIASHYAARHPATITQLILINPIGAPALEGPKAILTKLAIFYYWLGRKLPRKASHAWLSNPSIVKIMSISMTKSKNKLMQSYIHDQHLRYFSRFASPQVVAEAFTASVSHDVSEVAAQITSPTLLIAGEQDDITPLHKEKDLCRKIHDCKLVVIEHVGHLIHYETAPQAAAAIADYLS